MALHEISFSLLLKPEGLLTTHVGRKFVYANFLFPTFCASINNEAGDCTQVGA